MPSVWKYRLSLVACIPLILLGGTDSPKPAERPSDAPKPADAPKLPVKDFKNAKAYKVLRYCCDSKVLALNDPLLLLREIDPSRVHGHLSCRVPRMGHHLTRLFAHEFEGGPFDLITRLRIGDHRGTLADRESHE